MHCPTSGRSRPTACWRSWAATAWDLCRRRPAARGGERSRSGDRTDARRLTEHFNLEREEKRLADAGAAFVTTRDRVSEAAARDPRSANRLVSERQLRLRTSGSRSWAAPGDPLRADSGKEAGRGTGRTRLLHRQWVGQGIDTCGARGRAVGRRETAAVLGNGLDIIYPPENLDLYRRIAETGRCCRSSLRPSRRPAVVCHAQPHRVGHL